MNARKTTLVFVVFAFAVAPAFADWMPGDPHKMHYPQLPDPFGWDVSFTNTLLGDDWLCTGTGVVDDIHMWLSFRHDLLPSAEAVIRGRVEIWSDVPPGVGTDYSHPGDLLWAAPVDSTLPNVKLRRWTVDPIAPQGWLDPVTPIVQPQDHFTTFQLNIDPAAPAGVPQFVQQEGQIYWLLAHLAVFDPLNPNQVEVGWKTSRSPQYRDDAVFASPMDVFPPFWRPLEDPFTGQSLDLAFVITPVPEPTTVILLMVSTVGILALRFRRA